ncbi:MAG: hypothetical protein IPH07_25600 [Deltaproteobacteria bacterium]|nr:hypothetical protein [Deltaproteobacteria bacterium]MBP7288457.1 hypothetical protein [Nannocystaceae bacterium]
MTRALDVSSWNLSWPLLAVAACGPVIPIDATGTDGSTGGSASDSDTVHTSVSGDETPPQCVADADCDAGYDCIDGMCEYACNYCCGASPDGENHFRCSEEGFYECFDDVECGPGYVCENHYCVVEPGRDCGQLPSFAGSISLSFTEPEPIADLQYASAGGVPGLLVTHGNRVSRVTAGGTTPLIDAEAVVAAVLVADLDGDGLGDVIVATAGPEPALTPWLADAGGFVASAAVPMNVLSLATADLDGDAGLDVLARTDTGILRLQVDAGALAPPQALVAGTIGAMATLDRDLDGRTDVAAFVDGGYGVWSADGSSFGLDAPAGPIDPVSLHAANFAGTAVSDVLAIVPDFTTLVWTGIDGNTQPQLDGHQGLALTAIDADLDGDGTADLVVGRTDAVLTVIYGGPFHPKLSSPLLECPSESLVPALHLAAGDHDGDGDLDLAYSDGSTLHVALHQ